MRPYHVRYNEKRNIAEEVFYLHEDVLKISFIRSGEGAKTFQVEFLRQNLKDKEKKNLIDSARKLYYRQARTILHKTLYPREIKTIYEDHKRIAKEICKNKTEIDWLNDFIKREIFIGKLGQVIVLQRNKKNEKDKIIPYTFKDLFAAIRSQRHINENYFGSKAGTQGEVENIKTIEGQIKDLNVFARESNKEGVVDEKILAQKSGEITDKLKLSRDTSKVNAKNRVGQTATPLDSLDRKNLGSKAAILVGAQNDLGERISNIKDIAPNVSSRGAFLNRFRKYCNKRMEDVLGSLRYIESKKFQEHKKEIKNAINIASTNLSWQIIEPYKSVAQNVAIDLAELKNALDKGNKNIFDMILQSNIKKLIEFKETEQDI